MWHLLHRPWLHRGQEGVLRTVICAFRPQQCYSKKSDFGPCWKRMTMLLAIKQNEMHRYGDVHIPTLQRVAGLRGDYWTDESDEDLMI